MGKISLEGMEFYAHHGYHTDEIIKGNKFIVDLHFEIDFSNSAASDKLEETVNYEEIYNVIKEQMAIRSNLLEHAAQRILDVLKVKFPEIKNIELHFSKLNPRLEGIVQKASVMVTG